MPLPGVVEIQNSDDQREHFNLQSNGKYLQSSSFLLSHFNLNIMILCLLWNLFLTSIFTYNTKSKIHEIVPSAIVFATQKIIDWRSWEARLTRIASHEEEVVPTFSLVFPSSEKETGQKRPDQGDALYFKRKKWWPGWESDERWWKTQETQDFQKCPGTFAWSRRSRQVRKHAPHPTSDPSRGWDPIAWNSSRNIRTHMAVPATLEQQICEPRDPETQWVLQRSSYFIGVESATNIVVGDNQVQRENK